MEPYHAKYVPGLFSWFVMYSDLFQHYQAGRSWGNHYCEFGNPDKEVANSALRDEIRALLCDPKEADNGCGKGKNKAENSLLILSGGFIIGKKGGRRTGNVRAVDCSIWKIMYNNNIALDSGCSYISIYDDRGYLHRTISMLVFFLALFLNNTQV